MAYLQYMVINGENIPKPVSNDVSLTDIEADSSSGSKAKRSGNRVLNESVVWIRARYSFQPE